MHLILFAQTWIGLACGIRTLQVFRARVFVNSATLTKTGTGFVGAQLLCSYFCGHDVFLNAILTAVLLIANFLMLKKLERRKIDTLKDEFPIFLDRWILNMKMGHAAARGRDLALGSQSENFGALLRPLFLATQASNRAKPHLLLPNSTIHELTRIGQEAHLALARLEFLRDMIRKDSDFRRKSGQAARQTRIQAGVLLTLLLAMSAFTIHRFGWKRTYDLIALACVMAALGVAVMSILARKRKWKI